MAPAIPKSKKPSASILLALRREVNRKKGIDPKKSDGEKFLQFIEDWEFNNQFAKVQFVISINISRMHTGTLKITQLFYKK